MYFTTKIYEFKMKCRACSKEEFVIRTDPKNRSFEYVSGIAKRVLEFDTKEAGTLGVIDTDVGNGLETWSNGELELRHGNDKKKDLLGSLEQRVIGERKAMTDRDAMEYLKNHNTKTMLNDSISNSNLRAQYRVQRNAKKRRLGDAAAVGLGKGIELAELGSDDLAKAKEAFKIKQGIEERQHRSRTQEKEKFRSLRTGSLFGKRKIEMLNERTRKNLIDAPSTTEKPVEKEKRSCGKKKVIKIRRVVDRSDKGSSSLESSITRDSAKEECHSSSLSALGQYTSGDESD